MENLKTLFKFKFKYSLGLNRLQNYLSQGKNKQGIFVLMLLLVLFVLGMFGVIYIVIAIAIQSIAASIGMPELMPKIMFTLGQIVLLFSSFFSVFNMMFGGKDREFMASLPIKSKHIFLVNITLSYLIELAFSAFLVAPVLIIYAIGNGAGLMYWIYGILGIFLFPAFPMILSMIIVTAFMHIAGRFKHKELIITIISFIIIIAALTFNMFMNSGNSQIFEDGNFIKDILSSKASTVNTISYILPGAAFLTGAITLNGIAAMFNFMGILGLAGIFYVLSILIGDHMYFKILQRMAYSGTRRKKKLSSKDFTRISPVKAFFIKEWKLILRSPVYSVNGLANIIFGPIIIFFMFNSVENSQGDGGSFIHSLITDHPSAIVCILTAMSLFIGGLSSVGSTTISREGAYFWICKSIPVPVKYQMRGRMWAAFSMFMLCILLMLITFRIFIVINIFYILISFLIISITGFAITCFHIIIDIKHPKLIWSQENEAIKQNFNTLIAMLISFAFCLIIVIPAGLSAFGLIPEAAGYIISLILAAAGAYGGYTGMIKYAEKSFVKIW